MANSATRTLLINEAHRRGWKTETIGPNAYFLKITLPDGRSDIFRGSQPRANSALSFLATRDKSLALDFVVSYGYKVAPYELITNVQQAKRFLALHKRIVLKPLDSIQSQGVTVGITKQQHLERAFSHAMEYGSGQGAIVQKHLDGNLYRLTIVDGNMVAATWRTSIRVTGDGTKTIEQLVHHMNQDPQRGDRADLGIKHVDLMAVKHHLGEPALKKIPDPGATVVVSSMDSAPGGGAVNVTNEVHQDWQNFVKHMSSELGLFIAGFDFICDDIALPIEGKNVPLLEINGAPGLRIHEFPTVGEPVHIAPLLLDAVFNIDK